MPTSVRLQHSEALDISNFGFSKNVDSLFRELRSALIKDCIDILHIRTGERAHMWLACEFGDSDGIGGPATQDKLKIIIQLPLGDESANGEGPCWACSLSQMVDSLIDSAEERGLMKEISDGLRSLSDRIDQSIMETEE